MTLRSSIRPGERVYVQEMPVMAQEVIDASDPALVTLQTPSGATLKVGRQTVRPARDAKENRK